MNNWGTEIVSMRHVTFKHMKGKYNILADHISHLRSMHLNNSLDLKDEGSFDLTFWRNCPHLCRAPTQAEQNEIKIHEIQHVSLTFEQKEIKKLQETYLCPFEFTKNTRIRNKMIKRDYSLDPKGVLYKKIQDHGKIWGTDSVSDSSKICVIWES